MLLRYIGNLTKILPVAQKLPQGNVATAVRQLRRLPRQSTDFKVLQNSNESDELDSQLAEPTQIAVNEARLAYGLSEKRNDGNTRQIQKLDEREQLINQLLEEKTEIVPTFSLAAYVDKSETLQQLIKMGVDLSKIERRKGLPEFVLKLDFETNIKPYLVFLNDHGVAAENFGELVTKNPLLFKENMDDLKIRINYLESKKFTQRQIQRILTKNPFWLMFSTKRIDKRLGRFQQEFKLSGDDIRFLASKQPRLITYNMEHIEKSTFCIREEMGFDADEMKCLLLSKPRLWMMKSDELVERFAYAHKDMGLTHDMLIQFPEVLTTRSFRLKQRHEFLKLLGRAQYDPEKDLYISPKAAVEGTDYNFAVEVAKSDMETFRMFLRTR